MMDLIFNKRNGELSLSERNFAIVRKSPILREGVAGFGSNTYYYYEHQVGDCIVRRTESSLVMGNTLELVGRVSQ